MNYVTEEIITGFWANVNSMNFADDPYPATYVPKGEPGQTFWALLTYMLFMYLKNSSLYLFGQSLLKKPMVTVKDAMKTH